MNENQIPFSNPVPRPYNLKKLDELTLGILRVLSKLFTENAAIRSKALWDKHLSHEFPNHNYKQMLSRLQKLHRADLVETYYKPYDFLFEVAYWKITREGLLKLLPSS